MKTRLGRALDLMDEAAGTRVLGAAGAHALDEAGQRRVREATALHRTASARVPAHPVPRPATEPRVGKRSDVDYRAVKVYLPTELHKQAKRRAEDRGYTDFGQVVEELIRSWLEGGYPSA